MGMRAGRKGLNVVQGLNSIVQNYMLSLGPNGIPAPTPAAGNNKLYAQIKEAIRNMFGVEVRPVMRPVFRSRYRANIDAEHPYPTNCKMPKFDKFLGEETENTVEHVTQFTTQCRETAADPFLKFCLFNMSLIETAFT